MLTLCLAVLLVALYKYYDYIFQYWERRGVKHDKPLPLFGNNAKNYFVQKSVCEIAVDLYRKYPNEKVVGFYRATRPELVIRDPEIVRSILISDFNQFYARGALPQKTGHELLMRNLFFVEGDMWRLLRQRLTPAFTSGKLKAMFPLIVERAERLQARALTAAAAGEAIDARDLMARYTTDFIGACGFGLDSSSLDDDRSAFRLLGAKIFQISFRDVVVAMLKELFPEACKRLKYLYRVEKDFIGLVKDILKHRNYQPVGRNDFIDLCLEYRQQGTIVGDSIEKKREDGTPEVAKLEFDEEVIAAQIFVFFAAGFETSSSATSFTLHQLAYNPDIQKKVQDDIDTVLARHNNKLSYEAVKEMTYLECAFKESMRMLPSLGHLSRQCVRKYTFKDLNLTIDEGVTVIIPLQALHNDPQYFDSPEQFRPERFLGDQLSDVSKRVYMPFGDGPRACIGTRLGLMQSLAGLAAVMARCSVAPAAASRRHPRIDPKSGVVQVLKDGLPLMFTPREHVSLH